MVKIPHSSTVDFHGNRRQSTVRVKKYATLVLSITLVNDWLIFLNSFSVGLGNKFAARPVLYFPPQHVTTLPCKTSAADMFNFQQVSDGVHGHVQIWENKPDIWWSCGKNYWCILLWCAADWAATVCYARDLLRVIYLLWPCSLLTLRHPNLIFLHLPAETVLLNTEHGRQSAF